MAKARPSAFHDITTLDNRCTIGTCCTYGYGATTGWDPVITILNFIEFYFKLTFFCISFLK